MADIFRKTYRALTEDEKTRIERIKDAAAEINTELEIAAQNGADPRYIALARTNLEQSVMWATKAITG